MSTPIVAKQNASASRFESNDILKAAVFAGVLIAIVILCVQSPLNDAGTPFSKLTQASTADQAKQILDSWKRSDPHGRLVRAAIVSLYWDFGLIVSYLTFFILSIRSIRPRPHIVSRALKAFMIAVAVLGAASDVLENFLALRFLNGGEFASTVPFTRAKFICFFAALGYIALGSALRTDEGEEKTWRSQLLRWIQYLYILRVPLLVTLLFVGIGIADASSPGFGTMSRGVFDVEDWTELIVGSSMALLLSWSAMIVCRILVAYGGSRFGVRPPDAIVVKQAMSWWSLALWALPGCVLISRMVSVAQFGRLSSRIVAASAAVPIALVILCIADIWRLRERGATVDQDHAFVLPFRQNVTPHPLIANRAWFVRIFRWFGRGYWSGTRIHSGHILAFSIVTLLLAIYAVGGFVLRPSSGHTSWVPVIYFLVLLGALANWIGAGLSFWLDRFRVPVVLSALVVLTAMNMVRDADHYYEAVAPKNPVTFHTPKEFLDRWLKHHENDKDPLVVVTSAGGGIQASAWTAKVLTETDGAVCGGGRFKNSILLISSVSGGSVGTMYFADSYVTGYSPHNVRHMAAQSSLREIAWGIAYFDLIRWIPFWPTRHDRATAMEVAWNHFSEHGTREHWPGANHTLSSWADGVPAVMLNSTTVESGQRFALGNFRADATTYPGLTFQSLYPDCDLRVTTAARLSATFPFVSPVARARGCSLNDRPTYHLADGGYYDNFGISSALEWIKAAGLTSDTLSKHKLLWIAIRSFPDPADGQAQADVEKWKAGTGWGWVQQVAGPITTMMAVRTSGQRERGALELRQFFDSIDHSLNPVAFVFQGTSAPLSWHLQGSQITSIDQSWTEWQVKPQRSELHTVEGQFECGSK